MVLEKTKNNENTKLASHWSNFITRNYFNHCYVDYNYYITLGVLHYFVVMPKRSRKGKKAWRKNVDVRDEEDFGILREADDSRLFVVDKPGKQAELTRKERKALIAGRPLFAEKLTTPIGKEKRTGKPRKTETNRYIKRLADNLEKSKKHESKPVAKAAEPKAFFDLWDSDIVDDKVNPNAAKRYKEASNSLPASSLTAVDPGQSYHPKSADHQNLLSKALDQVSNKLEPELRATQRLKPTTRKKPDVEIKWNYSDSEDEVEESEEELDEEERQLREITKHYSTKFTTKQRNQIKRKKLILQRRREAKAKKKSGNSDR